MKTYLFAIVAGSFILTSSALARGRNSSDEADNTPGWCEPLANGEDRYGEAWATWLTYLASGGTLDFYQWKSIYWVGKCPRVGGK